MTFETTCRVTTAFTDTARGQMCVGTVVCIERRAAFEKTRYIAKVTGGQELEFATLPAAKKWIAANAK